MRLEAMRSMLSQRLRVATADQPSIEPEVTHEDAGLPAATAEVSA